MPLGNKTFNALGFFTELTSQKIVNLCVNSHILVNRLKIS
jgi:hypothetical protein